MGRGIWGKVYPFFFEGLRLTWPGVPGIKRLFDKAVDWPKWTKDMWLKCHTGWDVCSGLASITWTQCHKKVDVKYALDNMSQLQGGWTVSPFFVDDMSGIGMDEQSVHFHVCLGCSVTVDVVYICREIPWTIHVGRSVTRTRRMWTIHHRTVSKDYFERSSSCFNQHRCLKSIRST